MMNYMEGLNEHILNMCNLIHFQTKEKNKKSLQETAKILLTHKVLHQKRLRTLEAIRKQIEEGLEQSS